MRAYTGRTEPPVNVFKTSNGKGLPARTFTERLSVGSGSDRVDLLPAEYKGYAAPQPDRLAANVQVVYDELRGAGTTR